MCRNKFQKQLSFNKKIKNNNNKKPRTNKPYTAQREKKKKKKKKFQIKDNKESYKVAFFTGAGSEKRNKQKQHYMRCLPFSKMKRRQFPWCLIYV